MLDDSQADGGQPLSGCRVLEISCTVAAAYAGRMLAAMGATVIMLEAPGGTPLRSAPPLLDGTQHSALFAFLSAGKRSLVCDLSSAVGQQRLDSELQQSDIFIDDTPVRARVASRLDQESIAQRFPALVHLSVLPFGSSGPKTDWDGEEINLLHAGGEGYLLPNGYSHELFPDRPPLKIFGHFSEYQGGAMAALAALSAWWAALTVGGQYVDVSVQEAVLSVGAFALQRLGDGSLEHRGTRRFRYGGVFQTRDGYIELLTLEERQWSSLVKLLGDPEWAREDAWKDSLERSRRGDEINRHIREWMTNQDSDDVVQRAQLLGVPAAKYRSPAEVFHGEHERARGLFSPLMLDALTEAQILVAPFQFMCTPLRSGGQVPALGEMSIEPAATAHETY